MNNMDILAIDTSCDDTSIAVVEAKPNKSGVKFKILSNIVSSQVKLHQKYGGVYPTLAIREHKKNLSIVLKKALKVAGLNQQKPEIKAVAVTIGAGLEPCLWVGINFANELAKKWQKPLIGVNHVEAHLLVNLLTEEGEKIKFPALALVVSGGHTQLVLIKKIGQYKIIGETRDDAAGECFDKTARILGLPYPGGPAIAEKATEARPLSAVRGRASVSLPRPMLYSKDYDFSFSGLKTAVLYHHKKQTEKIRASKAYISAMAQEIQQAIIDILIRKTLKATREHSIKSIILGGGVIANKELTKQFKQKLKTGNYKINIFIPPRKLCTDNAAMIAVAGYYHLKDRQPKIFKAKANIKL